MSMQRSIRISLAGAIALVLFGITSVVAAQALPPQQATQQVPPPPPAQAQAASQQSEQGTESSATYPTQDGTLTVNAGMPEHVKNYGPPPAFKTLDTDHNGRISEAEARAYPPLDSDFLFASGGGKSISRAQYERWMKSRQ